MRIFPVGLFFMCLSTSTIGQTPSVNNLKEAQNTRKKYIDSQTPVIKTSKALFVNPFIGTGGHGHTYPGASAPFGMIQLSPDTRHDGWDGCSGYHYSDSIIYGFSHTHLSGTGVPDYCDLLVVPQSGPPKTNPGYSNTSGYGSRFSHDKEKASPGYYEVLLQEENIKVRLTVGERSGMHEYTFLNANEEKSILIDLDHRDKLIHSSLETIDASTIIGSRISSSWAQEQHFYFWLQTSVPYSGKKEITTNGNHKLLLTFPKETQIVKLRVGISAVDIKGAQLNCESEIKDWNFDDLRAKTVKQWNKELGRIDIKSADKNVLINFYTALYHSFLCPNLFSDVDGRFRNRNNKILQIENTELPQFTVFSLWDTYRATHPLFTLTQQKRTASFVETMMRQYQEGFDLPVWELAANETECMIGYHSVSVLADAYLKGLTKVDPNKLLEAMVYTSNLNEFGKTQIEKYGFIDASQEPESVSKTLEYAYDDYCIHNVAQNINNKEISIRYLKRSLNFINSYNPQTTFMQARRGGVWFSPFDPAEVNFNYTEANSWQYSLYTPHAVSIHKRLIGGDKSWENWLDRLFTSQSELSGREQVDITGLIGQYAHGNEPSHHMAYLYNYSQAPHKSQFYVDKILKEMYQPTPDGLAGNEDCGQMSSWYVLSALGFYQIAPSNPYYDFGRPIVDEAILNFENGNKLIIKTIENSSSNKYIQKIVFNGQTLEQLFISHEDLVKGGVLEFLMGPYPSKEFQTYPHSPNLQHIPENFVPSPYFLQSSTSFEDSMEISIQCALNNFSPALYEIEYKLGNGNWMKYKKAFTIQSSTTISCRAMTRTNEGKPVIGPEIENTFTKRDKEVHIKLSSIYSNQYAAGGETALIDGQRGGKEFRTGDWQGYWAQDLNAEITFDKTRNIKEIGLSCIRDLKSWIFFPVKIEVEVSTDGINFKKLSSIEIPEAKENDSSPETAEFITKNNEAEMVKSIRIKAVNPGKCPNWHLGAGNDTWIFADELILR